MKTTVLTLAAALLLSASGTAQNLPSYVPTTGLLGWWPFNGNANDESGNGNNGTVNGATLTTDRYGNTSSAYNFNGNYIRTLQPGPLGGGSRTVSFWLNMNNNSLVSHSISYGSNASGGTRFSIAVQPACSSAVGTDINLIASSISTNGALDIGNWHHMVIVFDSAQNQNIEDIKYYLDGVLINQLCGNVNTTGSVINTGSSEPLTFGRYCDLQSTQNNGYLFYGSLDDIGIWNRALTQQEVTNLYNASMTSIAEVTNAPSFSIYPIPASDNINININSDASIVGTNYILYDAVGRVVGSGTLATSTMIISLNGLSSGLYTLVINEQYRKSFTVAK